MLPVGIGCLDDTQITRLVCKRVGAHLSEGIASLVGPAQLLLLLLNLSLDPGKALQPNKPPPDTSVHLKGAPFNAAWSGKMPHQASPVNGAPSLAWQGSPEWTGHEIECNSLERKVCLTFLAS